MHMFYFVILFSLISNSLIGFIPSESNQKQADLIIFSFDRPLQLHALLSSIKTYVNNVASTHVLYRYSSTEYQKAYDEVHAMFPKVIFVPQGNEPKKDFKELFLKSLSETKTPYILFAPDDLIVKDYIDMNHCIKALEKYNAFNFNLRLGTHIKYSYTQSIDITMPTNSEVESGLFSFSFEGKSYWGYPNNLDFTLYKKEKIVKDLEDLIYHSPNTLEAKWAKLAQQTNKGLCFQASKALNMPLNLVQQDWVNSHESLYSAAKLLDVWNQGMMMDLRPYHKIANNSCHMAYNPTFIKRPLLNIAEKKITIIIPSYNNALYYEKNLLSVLEQNYNNYQMIYIDDASPDKTGNLVEEFIKKNNLQHKITLIKNEYNRKALANIYRAIHMCNPQDIIIELDGDDALSNPNILKEINSLFSTYDIWFAYAQYRNLPEEKAFAYKLPLFGIARPAPQKNIEQRKYRGLWYWSGLRIFYAWLAQQIKLEDLILSKDPYKGKFFPTSKDAAIVYPMLEMCGDKFMFVPDVWLRRNVDTPINDFKISNTLQQHCGEALKAIASYSLLKEQISSVQKKESVLTDVLINATSPNSLSKLLQSISHHVKNKDKIYIFINDKDASLFEKMRQSNKGFTWIEYNKNNIATIMQRLVVNKYVLLLHDSKKINDTILIHEDINIIEQTNALALFYDIDLATFGNWFIPQSLTCEQVYNNFYAWKFISNPVIINKTKTILMQSKDFKVMIQKIKDVNKIKIPFNLELNLLNKTQKIGLFYRQRKIS